VNAVAWDYFDGGLMRGIETDDERGIWQMTSTVKLPAGQRERYAD
jgi:hypothetical protein